MRVEKRILIIGPSWVGDMIMSQSLIMEIKSRSPETEIDVLAPSWSADVVERMPEVAGMIESTFSHGRLDLVARHRLGRSLSGKGYGQAIVLPNSWKSALAPALANIPLRTGYLGEQRWGLINDVRRLDKRGAPLMVQRFAALGRAADVPPPLAEEVLRPRLNVDSTAARQEARRLGVDPSAGPIVTLCPGAEFGPAKRWPSRHFREVAAHYLVREWQVVIVGSAADQEVANRISGEAAGRVINLAGKTSLTQAMDVLSVTGLTITNDSGLMHVASAVGSPVVAVYGSTDPGFTPPLGKLSRIVRLGIECSPCFKRECPLGHLDCLNNLSSAKVIEAAERLLAESD
jgi:heptosyltransferase-2